MEFSFKKFLSTISKKPEDNLQPSASSAISQPSAQPFWERNNPRSSIETAFEVMPSPEVISENLVKSQRQSSAVEDSSAMNDVDVVSKQALMGSAMESSRENSTDKELSANVIDAECTVVSDSSVFDDSPVSAMACSLNVSSKTAPSKMLNFDIDSLINKVKQSMLNPQSDTKKADTLQDNAVAAVVSVSDAVVSEVADNALPAASDKKIWRQGMSDGDKNSTKTVFIRKSLNPTYNNCAKETTSYESASKKLTREIEYFAKILDKVQADMAENEYRADEGVVKGVRGSLKQRLSELIAKVNSFSSDALEGDIRTAPVIPSVPEKVSDASVEYVFPSERKTNSSESDTSGTIGSRVNKCVDCNGHFVVNRTDTLEIVMLAHIQSQFHRSVVGNPVSDSNTTIEKTVPVEKTKKVKKDAVSVKSLMINRMTACLIDDSLLNCAVCGVACDARDPKPHIELKDHGDRLVAYNLREQRELITNNPDAFASFKLTDLHYVVNKIFVDPIGKFAYCGVCRKEVPAHQKNIEGHVDSPNHNKLLVAALDVAPNQEKEHNDVLGDFIAKSSVQQQPQPQPSNRMDSVGVPEESSLLRYVRKNHGFRHVNGMYACLICNVKRMSTVKKINGHFSGKQHLEISNKMEEWSGVSFDQKAKLLDNFVSATYDVQPIIYECLICSGFEPTPQLEGVLHHIASDRHIQLKEQYLRQPATVQQPPHLKYAKIVPFRQDTTKMYCMPCRMTLNSIVAAFEHVKSIPHNPDTLIEYIHNAGNSVYNCMACSISFRGDVALMSHTASAEHFVAKFAKEASKINQETNASPISTVNHVPKGFVVVEQDGSVLKNSAKKNNVKSKTVDNAARNKDKNNKEKDVKTPNAKNNKNVNQKVMPEEMVLLNNNGVVHLGNDTYFCRPCSKGKMSREEIFGHIFSVQHAASIQS